MHFSIPLLVASFFYNLLIAILYFSKERIKNIENKIYSNLIFITLTGVILDILGIYCHLYLPDTSILRWLVVKFYMLFLISFIYFLTVYVIAISNPKAKLNNNKLFLTTSFIYLISIVLNFVLPFSYHNDNNIVYISGINCTYVYFISFMSIIFWIFYMAKNKANIKRKKAMPFVAFIALCIPVIYIQMKNPELLLVTSLSVFIVIIMYHTIENPDVKVIEQLNIARDQADKANNAKSEFLSSMSHEIRTPLNAIVGFSQALKDEELSDQAKDEVNDIVSASESLLEIVNGILDISKIEANKLEIVNKEYNFKSIYHELCNLTKARLGEKDLELRFNYDNTIPDVLYGDSTRIKQIILNLLTNSVKYTKEGYVEFKVNSVVKNDVCRLIISVEDSGIGIKNENIDKLFSKFERFDLKQNVTIEGTGLGLAITKKLIDLMNGKIVVQSVYGKGSRFTIAIDQKIVTGKTLDDITEKVSHEIKELDLTGKKVVVVDDNSLNLKVATRLLRDYKLDIKTFESGFDILDDIKSGSTYDLILMDDMMPKMSGRETLGKLKEIDNFNIPVVILTANAIEGMKDSYLEAGFDDYLSKPIDKNELNRIISKFLDEK